MICDILLEKDILSKEGFIIELSYSKDIQDVLNLFVFVRSNMLDIGKNNKFYIFVKMYINILSYM